MRLKNIILVLVAVLTVSIVACNNKPTAVSNFAWEDETTDKRNDWEKITNSITDVVSVKTVFETDASASNPVVIANGNNVVVFYQKNHTFKAGMNPTTTEASLFYRGSIEGGTFFSVAVALNRTLVDGGSLSSPMTSPHVFLNGNNLTIAAVYNNEYIIYKTGTFSQKGKVGGIDEQNWNWTRPNGSTIAYQNDWKNYRDKENIASINLVAGVGKANTLPVSYTGTSNTSGIIPVSLPNFSFGAKFESEKGKFGQNSKAADNNNIIKEKQAGFNDSATSQGGYEIIYDKTSNKTYALYINKLYQIDGDNITLSDSSNFMTISGSTGGSVAVGSDGSIFTFTKDGDGLIFRKINKFEKGKTID